MSEAIQLDQLQEILAQNQAERTAGSCQVVKPNDDGEMGPITNIDCKAEFTQAAAPSADVQPAPSSAPELA